MRIHRFPFLFSLLLAAVLLGGSGVAAAGPSSVYPTPLPDFVHAGSPHYPNYNPTVGNSTRPMLVLYEYFTDKPLPPGKGELWAANRFFAGFPSVGGYFTENSHGRAGLTRASETQGYANNGVVVVPANSTWAEWSTRTSATNSRRAIVAADPYVNFASYDRDHNGVVTSNELVIMKLEVHPSDTGFNSIAGGGATRGVDNGPALDGVSLNGQTVGLGNSSTNIITLAHEVMHTAFGNARDWYQYGIDGYDVMEATITSTEFFTSVNAWNSMHLGWSTPTIVTSDGYRTVEEWDDSGQSYLLYDPAKGTNDYMLVENRVKRAGTYDQNAGDNGINVWRINEANFYRGEVGAFPISRFRPCSTGICGFDGGRDYFSAFDPSDSTTPQRTVAPNWQDGSTSAVAIRAIGPANRYTRAYFDVPGPGILVDCFDSSEQDFTRTVRMDVGTTGYVTVPVMNTGEYEETFQFTARNLPPGWVAGRATRVLAPHASGQTVSFKISPPEGQDPDKFDFQIEGRSTKGTVYSSSCDAHLRMDSAPSSVTTPTETATSPASTPIKTVPAATAPQITPDPAKTDPEFGKNEVKALETPKAQPSASFDPADLPSAAELNYTPSKAIKFSRVQVLAKNLRPSIGLTLPERAKIRFTVRRFVGGRLVSTRRLSRVGEKGQNSVSLKSDLGCPRPGRYLVKVDLYNSAGHRSDTRSLRFDVVSKR